MFDLTVVATTFESAVLLPTPVSPKPYTFPACRSRSLCPTAVRDRATHLGAVSMQIRCHQTNQRKRCDSVAYVKASIDSGCFSKGKSAIRSRKENAYEKRQNTCRSGGGSPHLCHVQCRRGVGQRNSQGGRRQGREAAIALSKTGNLAQFNQKSGPWVWKDTYIFIQDCSKKVMAAHPIKPEMIDQDLLSVKDATTGLSTDRMSTDNRCNNRMQQQDATTGQSIYPDSAAYCKTVQDSPFGVWGEY